MSNEQNCGLSGLYIEDVTGPRYTREEIDRWVTWSKGYISVNPNNSELWITVHFQIDDPENIDFVNIAPYYYGNHLCGKRAWTFSSIVKDLEKFVIVLRKKQVQDN